MVTDWAWAEAAGAALAVPAVPQAGEAVGAGKPACFPGRPAVERSRHAGGYSGYTCAHLPVRKDNAPLLKAEDAKFASFAARMAFSSFWMRPSDR